MKLLSAQQFRDWDAYTIQHEPISSIDLMERAALQCADYISTEYTIDRTILLFCAKGNNGGDGLAIARLLIGRGFEVRIYILEMGKICTNDFQSNLHRLHACTTEIHFIQSIDAIPSILDSSLLIDALYGTGLKHSLNDLSKDIVVAMNLSGAEIISIDIPSGLYVDQSSKGNIIVKANTTLTFQALKLCFLAAENAPYFGRVHVLDIQLIADFLNEQNAVYHLIEAANIKSLYKPRHEFAHKGLYGHALLIAGSEGKMGAAILSARAAMRSGLGMLTVSLPANTDIELHIALPEAMVVHRDLNTIDFEKFAVIAIGPGLGTEPDAEKMVQTVIENARKPILLDADALNIISKNRDWLSKIPANSILTPHPKEFDRLFGVSENEFERWQKAILFSEQYHIVILVKGHHTLIASKGKAWLNTSGNVGLAKAGSGDTLTGVITALLAQGYPAIEAAIVGVYLHGHAADLALANQSKESLLASDTIELLGDAFKKFD
jgi:ADP-dependent NAD(P)H-hydrate dehydratase / NAD(P)H-hydrate epimerase